ncbi:NAD-binding protein [Pseudarthrobacter sulfonivorans]|uniref:NAD-binding protein n=1 Tax=Pseudarthrobacter sulfonivorans TaxID=121292 RepID=UPI00359356A0
MECQGHISDGTSLFLPHNGFLCEFNGRGRRRLQHLLYGSKPGNSQAAKLVNNLVLGINMNAVAEGLKFGAQYNLPEEELLNLFKVSTGDSWVTGTGNPSPNGPRTPPSPSCSRT